MAMTTPEGIFLFKANPTFAVIGTSCSVFVLLVTVMIIFIVRKRYAKRRGGTLRSAVAPPSYDDPRRASFGDEHDRAALIAYADEHPNVLLPSYEEAVRNPIVVATGNAGRSLPSRGDYRPLPGIPSSLRIPANQTRAVCESEPATTHGGHDQRRNSIVTTASIATRDNLSLTFGSLDTVNVSDGHSTTVTVDTFNSNPSIATSNRATVGSIESPSANGSLHGSGPFTVPVSFIHFI